LCVSFKFVDHDGGRQGNTAQAIDRWRHPVASSESLDVLHRAMRPALYRHTILMAIEIASNLPAFLVVVDSLLPTAMTKKHSNNMFKLKQRRSIVHWYVVSLFVKIGTET
jgi:hypothetical protein